MSIPSAAAFLGVYPEFDGADEALINAKLALAAARTDARAFGSKYEAGVMLLAADLLAKSPEGRRSRLMMDESRSIYDEDLKTMRRVAALGRSRVA